MRSSHRSAVFVSALLLGWSASSYAAPPRVGEVATMTVKFADLDIATAAGAQTLYQRIVAAARAVCMEPSAKLMRECRARAVADAVNSVGSPLLIATHRSRVEGAEEVVRR
jgi:UrcA family protein